jgi:hypothetical protein
MMNEENDIFSGACIFSYTRDMAIADGVLIDISGIAREAGFKVPVAVSEALYNGYLVPGERLRDGGQSEAGRIWDMLMILSLSCRGSSESTLHISVRMLMENGLEMVKMKSVIDPGDNLEPVITIMLPNED